MSDDLQDYEVNVWTLLYNVQPILEETAYRRVVGVVNVARHLRRETGDTIVEGAWRPIGHDNRPDTYRCGICGHEEHTMTNYCSQCGARMTGLEEQLTLEDYV